MSQALSDHLLEEVRSASIEAEPWAYAYIPECLPSDTARSLWDSFDGFALQECERSGADKSYQFATARLDELAPDALPSDEWRAVVAAIRGAEYRGALAALTDIPLDDMSVTLSVWEYRDGDWLAPHLDKPEKLVTQIFYLTDSWQEGDGGRLLILSDEDAASVRRALPPALGSSAVLVRSQRSWHAVEAPAQPGSRRRSLTLTYWREPTAA